MSFSGKKYRRVRCENIDELVKASISLLLITMPPPRISTIHSMIPSKEWKNIAITEVQIFFIACDGKRASSTSDDTNENIIAMLKCNAPTFSFTRLDEDTFNFALQMETRVMSHDFKLGQEHQMERRDGSKVMITYALEGDNVLKQVIKQPDGKISYFRREFSDKEAKMTITIEGTDIIAEVYYEVVE